ncbi:MAG: SpoIIE family protein phosphatase, partial [bacterium]|nr:SpoIIE family protein phosphatase [bacterium]
VSTVDWEIDSIIKTVSEIKPTPNSFVLFADKGNDYIIASTDPYLDNSALVGEPFEAIPWYNTDLQNGESFQYHNKKYISYIKELDNEMLLIVNVPNNELMGFVILHAAILLAMLMIIGIIFSIIIYFALKKYINTPIEQLMEIANKIGQGNLDAEITIQKPEEFAKLAETFGTMAKDIKEHISNIKNITADKERMESELSIAKDIQLSAVPNSFFNEMKEFDIFATMDTAKEVGGDFYDFFFIDNSKFVFLIADVSGKGIPAALFMMTTKTLIKNLAMEGYQPKELFEKINNQIYENNKQGFFVTLFAAIIDTNTGKITFINCGHNPPLIKKQNGNYEYKKMPANLVLGAMGNIEYQTFETTFDVGDTIFLYTDGVSEAMNKDGELYSEKQLLDCINNNINNDVTTTIKNVRKDVYRHADGAEQSDDITMLIFKYNGKDSNTFVAEAKKENYDSFLAWLEKRCTEKNVPQNIIMKTELAAEELFLNIANYAYAESAKVGTITAVLEDEDNSIVLKFIDNGVKYNPLEKADPDISLNASDRQIGGLGIFMVKNTVDDIQYEYKNNQNILTITIRY